MREAETRLLTLSCKAIEGRSKAGVPTEVIR
jgi:hypothetical protein